MSRGTKSDCSRSSPDAYHVRRLVDHEFGLLRSSSGLRSATVQAKSRTDYRLNVFSAAPDRSRKCATPPLGEVAAPIPATKMRVFTFGKGKSEGNKSMKSLLGGKGANLAEMASIGLSVPPGLTISTEACQEYQENGRKLPNGLWEEILGGLQTVEEDIGVFLGDPARPLLLSVRSGAAISMPGMMDTVLNLGLNDEVAAGLAAKSGEWFAYDSYRRFLDMFGNVAR